MDDEKYLINGQAVNIIEKTPSGYIIESIYEDDQGQYHSGKVRFAELADIFDEPPTLKINDEIQRLTKDLYEIRDRKRKLQDELSEIEAVFSDRLTKYKKHEQLKYLDMFLDGKMSHFVFHVTNSPTIKNMDEMKDDDGTGNELRLLSLLGKSNGDLSWKANRWSDGSGASWKEVIPCTSKVEAMAILTKIVLEKLASYEIPKDMYKIMYMIESADLYGIEISEKYRIACKKHLQERYDKNIKEREAKLITERLDREKAITKYDNPETKPEE